MIDNSDIVLIYTVRNYGGAYEVKKYAERSRKKYYDYLALALIVFRALSHTLLAVSASLNP